MMRFRNPCYNIPLNPIDWIYWHQYTAPILDEEERKKLKEVLGERSWKGYFELTISVVNYADEQQGYLYTAEIKFTRHSDALMFKLIFAPEYAIEYKSMR